MSENETTSPKESESLNFELQRIHDAITQELEQLVEAEKQASTDDERRVIKERKEFLTRSPGLYAFGGTRWSERRSMNWYYNTQDLRGVLQSGASISIGKPAIGVGERWGRRFIIWRELQHPEHRGGYYYTLMYDPGEVLWRMYDHNGALVMRNILSQPALRHQFLESPENILASELADEKSGIYQAFTKSDRNIEPMRNESFERALTSESEVADPKASIGLQELAAQVAALPAEVRRTATWLVNETEYAGERLGANKIFHGE